MKKVEVIKGGGLLSAGRNGIEINLKRVAAYCRVSTDSEDQLQSYHSQVKYYTDLINENSDWTMAGIYADEAITGTQIDKRLDFQRLINDCMNGDIDLSRRSWHSNSQYNKVIWQCVTGTKKGKKYCTKSKRIEEIAIEKAFLESYRQLTSNNKDIVNKFLELIESTLNDNTLEKNIKKLEGEISRILNKQNSLVDLRLEEKIDGELYEQKYVSLQNKHSEKKKLLNLI